MGESEGRLVLLICCVVDLWNICDFWSVFNRNVLVLILSCFNKQYWASYISINFCCSLTFFLKEVVWWLVKLSLFPCFHFLQIRLIIFVLTYHWSIILVKRGVKCLFILNCEIIVVIHTVEFTQWRLVLCKSNFLKIKFLLNLMRLFNRVNFIFFNLVLLSHRFVLFW